MAKRYTYQDNFEMLILRHDYLSRVENPDPRWVKEFEGVVNKTSWIMFNKFRSNFTKIGYEIEDVINITNCYMISYMSLYSIRMNETVLEKIKKSYKKRFGVYPKQEYIDRKEKINMINFLRQRLQHAALICSRKLRNINVDTERIATYAYTEESVSVPEHVIFSQGEKFGYRKVTKDEFKEIKKLAKKNKTSVLKDKFGYSVIQIDIPNNGIGLEDYKDLFVHTKEDVYHRSPEQSLRGIEDEIDMTNMIDEFFGLSDQNKKSCLKDFIDRYKDDKSYKIELREARKMLKSL